MSVGKQRLAIVEEEICGAEPDHLGAERPEAREAFGRRILPVPHALEAAQEDQEGKLGIGVADAFGAELRGALVDPRQSAVMGEMLHPPVLHPAEGVGVGEMRMPARGAPDMGD